MVAENDFTNEDYNRKLEYLLNLAVLENGNLMLENYNLKQKIKFLEEKARDWAELTDSGLRLRCGELTAQEIRTIRSVLNAIITLTSPRLSRSNRSGSTSRLLPSPESGMSLISRVMVEAVNARAPNSNSDVTRN